MPKVTFADALKVFREGLDQHTINWRACVLANTIDTLNSAWEETLSVLEAHGVRVAGYDIAKRLITTNDGSTIRFFLVDGGAHSPFRFSGWQFCQIIWLFNPDPSTFEYMEGMRRSPFIEAGLRTDMVDQVRAQ